MTVLHHHAGRVDEIAPSFGNGAAVSTIQVAQPEALRGARHSTALTGDDLLDGEIMTHGTYAELLLNVDEDNLAWDMQVEDTDGNSLEWYDIDISDMPSDGFVIELLWDGSEGTANLLEDMTQLEGDYSAVQ